MVFCFLFFVFVLLLFLFSFKKVLGTTCTFQVFFFFLVAFKDLNPSLISDCLTNTHFISLYIFGWVVVLNDLKLNRSPILEGRQISMIAITMLRVRAVFHRTVRVCHVYCNFKIGFTCRITVIFGFGTLKDGSLLINTLASNICLSYRKMFQNGVDALSKVVDAFLSKSSKFYLVRIIW